MEIHFQKKYEEELSLEKLFKLKENGTNVRTEIVAGVTTFLAMAYILAVNPSILSAAGMPSDAIFAATSISAAFATLIMAFFANYPVVLASGMGLNAYFAFSVVPQLASQGITDPWKVALTDSGQQGAQEPQARHFGRYRFVHCYCRSQGCRHCYHRRVRDCQRDRRGGCFIVNSR